MKLIDIHVHLEAEEFDEDREEVIRRLAEEECGVINVGTDLGDSRRAVKLAEENAEMWASVGVHPEYADREVDWGELEKLARREKVVAIGECGLDYFKREGGSMSEAEKKGQKEIFEKQIKLAIRVGKPLMMHLREAYDDALALLEKYPAAKAHAHFFSGDWATAKKFLNRGITLSFAGVITFTDQYDEVIKNAPLEMIMAETDSPLVAPVPHRGKRNEPLHVRHVIQRIAEIRGERLQGVQEALLANARRVFAIS